MVKNGSYVRLNLGGQPPRYKYGQLLQDPFDEGEQFWYLRSDADGGGRASMLITPHQMSRIEEITEQEYFWTVLSKAPRDR